MNVTHAYAAIAALDLSTIRNRLMHPRAGLGWSAARTQAAESDYREFLTIAKLFPQETPAPTADVDSFWHFHILDTMKYAVDCSNAFGYFLDHKPDVEFEEEDGFEDKDGQDMRTHAYCSLTTFKSGKTALGRQGYCSRAVA